MEQYEKKYYPNSQTLESEGVMANEKKQGVWKFYYPNGKLERKGFYKDDLAEGEFQYFNEEGKIISKGEFKNGNWDGEWVWYDENECEDHRGYYQNGLKTHKWNWYFANGKVMRELHYVNDLYYGPDTSYFEDGQISQIRTWLNGELDGEYEERNEDGIILEKGIYNKGFKDGKFIFYENGKVKEIIYEIGVPILDESQTDEILKALNSKKDIYKIKELIEKVVGWKEIYPSIWYLIKHGYKIPIRSLSFFELSGLMHVITPEHLVALLKNTDFAAKETGWPAMFKFWSYYLDKMCMYFYKKTPETFDKVWEEFTPLAKEGFKTVLVRFGKMPANNLSKKMAQYIAYNLLHNRANGNIKDTFDYVWWYEHDELFELDTQNPENFIKFVEKFVPFENFKTALLNEALTFKENLPFPQADYAIKEANVEQFTKLYKAVSTSDYKNIYRAFLELRNDSIIDIEHIINEVKEESRIVQQQAETAVIVAILKRKQEKLPIPEWYDDLINFNSFYNGVDSTKNWFVGLEQTQEALLYLPQERLEKLFLKVLDNKYPWEPAFYVVHLVNEDLQNKAIEVLIERLQKDLSIYGSQSIARGISQIENIKWFDSVIIENQHDKTIYEVLVMAIVFKMASLAEKGVLWEEKYDLHLQIHLWLPKYGDDFDSCLQPYFEKIIQFLPQKRVLKQFLPQIENNKATTIRIFSLLSDNSPEELTKKAFEVAATHKIRILNTNWIQRCLKDKLKIGVEKTIKYAIKAGANDELLNIFKDAIGGKKFQKIYAELNGKEANYQEVPPAQILKQLCETFLSKNPEAIATTIYYLSADYNNKSIQENEINRIRGNALHIKQGIYPMSKRKEPMNHIFTLDLATLPKLKELVGKEYRALAFFSDEEDEQSPSETVLIKEEDIIEITPSENGYSFDITEINVPTQIFSMGITSDLSDNMLDLQEIRKRIFQAPAYVLGEPIFIQEPDTSSTFYMQFDDRFGNMNLGDSGIMYVFGQEVFWQCY